MDCFCGCGTEVPRKLTAANLLAGEVAVDLLAWDKVRTSNHHALADDADRERLIARGADRYRELISTLHGEARPDPMPAAEDWLQESFQARRAVPGMMTKGSLLNRAKLNLDETDFARLDRARPEQSFSATAAQPAGAEPATAANPVEQLKGLNELHAAGVLTDEEFAEAKARVIARLD